MNNVEILVEYPSPYGDYSLVIDEEKEVCYAYLKENGRVVAHVWIYNRGDSPEEFTWKSKGQAPPFKNSKEYVAKINFLLPQSEDAFAVEWTGKTSKGSVIARVFINEIYVADFISGNKVGRSLLSGKANVFALPLTDRIE